MKKRRILVIHEYGLIRNIIKRTLAAELPDVDLHPVASAAEALKRLEDETFDMIVSANEMSGMNGTEIFTTIRAVGKHKKTGFLLLTSSLDKQNRMLFMEKGITNVLKMPFEAGQLAREVENLSTPREWRQHRRIEIPDTRVLIQQAKGAVPAEIVNVSLGGMLCDVKVADGIPQFARFHQVYIQFPEKMGVPAVNAKGYILRQTALHWLDPPKPETLQMAWRFTLVSKRDTEIMKDVLDQAILHLDAESAEFQGGG